jgi:hypothetical protein
MTPGQLLVRSEDGRDKELVSAERVYWIFFTGFASMCVIWLVLATWSLHWPVLPAVSEMRMVINPQQHWLDLSLSIGTLLLGLGLIWAVPDSKTARWFAVGLVGTSVGFSLTAHHLLDALSPGMHLGTEPTPLSGMHLAFHLLTGVAYTGGLLLFPDGRWPRVSTPTAVAVATLIAALGAFVYLGHQPAWFIWYCGLAMIVAGLGTQLYKVRDSPTAEDHRVFSTFAVLFFFALMVAIACLIVEWLSPLEHWFGLANIKPEGRDLTLALTVLSPFLAATTLVVWAGIIWYPKLAHRSVQFHRRRYVLGALTGILLASYVLIEFAAHVLIENAELSQGGITICLLSIGFLGLITERGRERISDGLKRLMFGTEESVRQHFKELMAAAPILTATGVVSALAGVLADTLTVSSGRLTVFLPDGAEAVYAWPTQIAETTYRLMLGPTGRAGALEVGGTNWALTRTEQRLVADLGAEAAAAIQRLASGADPHTNVVVLRPRYPDSEHGVVSIAGTTSIAPAEAVPASPPDAMDGGQTT